MDASLIFIKPVAASCNKTLSDNDADILARCRAGEREAFGIFLNRYRDRVINLAYQLLGQREDAEDVAQEAFTQAFINIHSFRGEAQFFTWLYRITVNLCLQRKRRTKQHEVHEEQNMAEQSVPDNLTERSELLAVTKLAVEQALSKLSEPLRVVLILREMHELSYEEVAAILKIPIGTVRSRLSEARRKFKEIWETCNNDSQEYKD